MHGPQDSPNPLLGHSQAQLLLRLPQGRVHHVPVSGVTLATWETEQAEGSLLLGPLGGAMKGWGWLLRQGLA